MNGFERQSQDSVKRRFEDKSSNTLPQPRTDDTTTTMTTTSATPFMSIARESPNNSGGRLFPGFDDDELVAKVVPPVTVVLEGRSICQRISLDKHASYDSLARALRQMFVVDGGDSSVETDGLDLSNAVPGHLIAYEDMENDLLLAGDLTWKDFVRVAKRIRILPVKGNTTTRRARGSNS